MHIWNEFLHFIIIATRKLATDHLEYIMILFCCCRVYSATLGYPQAWERMCQSTHQWTGLKGSCCFQRIRHHCSSCGCIIRYIRCGYGKTSCQLLELHSCSDIVAYTTLHECWDIEQQFSRIKRHSKMWSSQWFFTATHCRKCWSVENSAEQTQETVTCASCWR